MIGKTATARKALSEPLAGDAGSHEHSRLVDRRTVAVARARLTARQESPKTMAQIESAGPNAIEARRALASGAVLLDVRTRAEFHEGHLPHAVNIPLQELAVRIDEVRRRARAVVVYCRSGNRSSEAAQLLASTDLARVIDLGSINNYAR